MHFTNDVSANPLVRVGKAIERFWFQPADPTTLGLIRLFAGILALYTHLAYTYDLYEFFGPDAWMSLRYADKQRLEMPRPGATTGWYPTMPALPLDGLSPEQRANVLDGLAAFPETPAERERLLALLRQPTLPPDVDWGEWTFAPRTYLAGFPPETLGLAPRGRTLVANFIRDLPKDKAERARVIDYMKEWSFDPRTTPRGGFHWSLWYHVTDRAWMIVAHIVVVLIFVMFAVGFCTRVTSVLAWLAALSYLQRAPNTLFGGDTMMNILLLYLMIGPSGAALSVDRWIAHWWAVRQARRAGRPDPEWTPAPPMVSANFAQRMLQIHFCIIYFSAGTSKLLGGWWWNGNAIYYTMANYEFSPLRYGYYHSLLQALCANRLVWEFFMAGGTYFTLALELSLPFLVWNRRLRLPYVICSFMLHTAIAIFLGLVIFSLLMATMVLAFVPGETMRALIDRLRRQPRTVPSLEALPVEEALEKEEAPVVKTHIRAKHARR